MSAGSAGSSPKPNSSPGIAIGFSSIRRGKRSFCAMRLTHVAIFWHIRERQEPPGDRLTSSMSSGGSFDSDMLVFQTKEVSGNYHLGSGYLRVLLGNDRLEAALMQSGIAVWYQKNALVDDGQERAARGRMMSRDACMYKCSVSI